MSDKRVQLGILGAGMIATVDYGYLPQMGAIRDKLDVVAIADPRVDVASRVADQFQIPAVYASLSEMLEKSDVEAVLNLTPIPLHAETSFQVLQSGRHLASEKPLATTLAEADKLVAEASARSLIVVCSPSQVLWPSRQEARRLVRAGAIGKVAFARVRSSHDGPAARGWPADPSWFYQKGAGPLYDMGVYGISEITGILGPVKRVSALAGITERTRTVDGGPFAGLVIEVTADDNVVMLLDFGEATFAMVDGTFNVLATHSPKIELFGRQGALNLRYDWMEVGDEPALELYRKEAAPGLDGWTAPNLDRESQAWADSMAQALLVDHLADCILGRATPILTAEFARHVLEVMVCAQESAVSGKTVTLTTSFEWPEAK